MTTRKEGLLTNRKCATTGNKQEPSGRVGLVRASKTVLSLCEKNDIFPDTCIVRKVIVKLTFSYIVKNAEVKLKLKVPCTLLFLNTYKKLTTFCTS